MKDWTDKDQQKYDEAIGALRGLSAQPSPFMKTRILANVREQEAAKKPALKWWAILLGSFAMMALATVISLQVVQKANENIVEIGKPYLVKADLTVMEDMAPSYIKVELVGSVEFSSEKFEHIKQMRSLTMSWERLAGKQYLPVVVKGTKKGESHIKVHFYNSDGEIIKTKDYRFDFQKEAS